VQYGNIGFAIPRGVNIPDSIDRSRQHLVQSERIIPDFRMESCLVSSVRGSGSLPTTAASAASGCTGLLRAFLGAAAFFGVGIGQLERAGLGSQTGCF
jgi:hypothetical protein